MVFELLPMKRKSTRPPTGEALRRRVDQVRLRSCALAAPLSDADASVQSMPDASPAKWHLAHTTWFFRKLHSLGVRCRLQAAFDDRFALLFNSYYEAKGARISRFFTRFADAPIAR